LGTGLATVIGLANPQFATAETPKDTGYSDLTHAQAHRMVLDRATRVSYDTWEKEVLQYDGAVLVLFNSSCVLEGNPENIERNKEIEISELADKYKDAKVNDLPIKFTNYDQCGKSKSELLGIEGGLQTRLYINGRLLDIRMGGPVDLEKVPNAIKAGSAWIDSNLLGKPYIKDGQEMRIVYNGTTGATFIPF